MDKHDQAWDDLLFGAGDDTEWDYHSSKTCKHCGKQGLHWRQLSGAWRLFDDNALHQCLAQPKGISHE